MTLEFFPFPFTIARMDTIHPVIPRGQFVFTSVTDHEISVVCPTDCVTGPIQSREDGWLGFRIVGTLDFSLIGILAKISGILAAEKIGIFAISTFDTDYFFFKKENLTRVKRALAAAEYGIREAEVYH